MPTYEYKCLECNQAFDFFQNINDKHLDKCPKCDGKVKRLIGSGSGIIFKGSGFYATDYRKKSPAPSAKSSACPKMSEGCDGCKHK